MLIFGDPKKAHIPKTGVSGVSLLATRYDNLFRCIVTAGWGVKSDGNVEAPSGHFAIVEMPQSDGERNEMWDAIEDAWPTPRDLFDEVEAGWYLTLENDQGFIWIFAGPKHLIDDAYGQLEEAYAAWNANLDAIRDH